MTVASELIKLKDNLTDSYTAVENKGGILPQHQNFDNLPDAIDSITTGGTIDSLNITPTTSQQTITASGGTDGYSPITVNAVTSSIDANIVAGNIKDGVEILGVTGSYQGSGGDTVYADNRLGRAPVTDEKVLLTRNTTVANSYSTASSDTNYGPSFIVDEKFYQTRGYSSRLDILEPNTWNALATFVFGGPDPRVSVVRNGAYWWWTPTSGGSFIAKDFNPYTSIANNNTYLALNSSLKFNANDGKIYSTDETQSYDTGLGKIAPSNRYIFQLFGNTLACLRSGNAYFIDLTNFPNCTSTQVLSGGKTTSIGFSGINEGDYVITADNNTVGCYKLVSGSYVLDKEYSNWYIQNSIYFDCSNGLLCVVDAYKYPHTYIIQNGNIFEKEIPSDIRAIIHTDISNNTTSQREYGDIYFQSNKSLTKFVWGWWTGSAWRRFCQAKADGTWYISESSVQNYQPLGSFTAYITGNTDLEGNYEVKTLLPKSDTVTCTLEVSDDTIIPIIGVEEI